MRNYLLYYVLRIGSAVVIRIPVRLSYALASAVATAAFLLIPPARRGIEANLRLAFPQVPATVRRRITLSAFRHDALNWVDTLRIPSLDPQEIPGLVEVDRWDLLVAALAAGNGVVLTLIHIGNYDLVGQAVAARGIPFSVPVERIQPERLYRFLTDRRAAQGICLLPVEQATRHLLQALRHGEVVGIAADRLVTGKGVEVQFFSHRCEFARGPATLARRTGAALLVGVGIRRPGKPFSGYIVPVEVPHTDDAHADEIAATQNLARIAESFIRTHPGQWLAFSPICAYPTRYLTPDTYKNPLLP